MTHGAPRAKPVVPPLKYPPTPLGAKAFRCAATEASEGYPPVAKSAEATDFNLQQLRHGLRISSTGKASGFLRRRIRISIKPLSKVLGSPVCGGVRPSGFDTRFSEALLHCRKKIDIKKKLYYFVKKFTKSCQKLLTQVGRFYGH